MKKMVLFVYSFLIMFCIFAEVSAMQVKISKNDNDSFMLDVESSDTIEAVKQKIYDVDKACLPETFELLFDNNVLKEGRTLADYGIQKDSNIFISFLKQDEGQNEQVLPPNTSISRMNVYCLIILIPMFFVIKSMIIKC